MASCHAPSLRYGTELLRVVKLMKSNVACTHDRSLSLRTSVSFHVTIYISRSGLRSLVPLPEVGVSLNSI